MPNKWIDRQSDSLSFLTEPIISSHNLNTFFRYRHAKDRAQRMVVIPRYEPVFVEPNLKQYEVHIVFQIQLWTFLTHIVSPQVQVLQKSMNLDDMDGSTGQRLGRQPGRSNIEARRFDPGVSYITT